MPGTWGGSEEGVRKETNGTSPLAPRPQPPRLPYLGAGLYVVLHHGHSGHGEERLRHLEGQRPEPGPCGAERGRRGTAPEGHPAGPAHLPFCGPPMRMTALSGIAARLGSSDSAPSTEPRTPARPGPAPPLLPRTWL